MLPTTDDKGNETAIPAAAPSRFPIEIPVIRQADEINRPIRLLMVSYDGFPMPTNVDPLTAPMILKTVNMLNHVIDIYAV